MNLRTYRAILMMSMSIKTKSVYSAIQKRSDGVRILATRIRGRGLPKDRYDVWMANLAPTEKLLRSFQSGAITWKQFSTAYKQELFESASLDRRNRVIKNHGQKFTLRLLRRLSDAQTITLLCHCSEDEPHCHRRLLQAVLEREGL